MVDKSRGRFRTVKSFGAADNEQDIRMLEALARQYILERTGHTELFPYDSDSIEDVLSSVSDAQIQMVGPELIFGRLYDRIGYDRIDNELFRHTVICRLFNPGSVLRVVDYLHKYLKISYEADKVYRIFDNFCAKEKGVEHEDIKGWVELQSLEYTRKTAGEGIGEVFCYIIPLDFEASQEDGLKRTGLKKNLKQTYPKVFVGVLLTTEGNLIGYEVFAGKTVGSRRLLPKIEKLAGSHGLSRPTLVADAGLLSKKDIADLKAKNYKYILRTPIKNENIAVKEMLSSYELRIGEVIVINSEDNRRMVVSKMEDYAKKDAQNRAVGLANLQKRFEAGKLTRSSVNNRGYNKYLKLDDSGHIFIDMVQYEMDAQWDGIIIDETNTELGESDVIRHFCRLQRIRQALVMSKTDLQIRPLQHKLINRIEGHVCICMAAYTILLELERILCRYNAKNDAGKLTLDKVRDAVKTMYRLTYSLPGGGTQRTVLLKMDEKQQRIYDLMY